MRSEGYGTISYFFFVIAVLVTAVVCVAVGSVTVPLGETISIIWNAIAGKAQDSAANASIIVSVRLPRVICVALTGASLSLGGAAMQGLLRNPLADGSTLGVSSGASLGTVLAIALGVTVPALPFAGTMVMAVLFAFLSLAVILFAASRIDNTLSTSTIILIGIVFSMFASSLISLVITFAGEKVGTIMFWTMGSLSGSTWANVIALFAALAVCGTILLATWRELNAFAIGEANASSLGVDVKKVKLRVLICVSVLIGVCVSVGGTIAFVGLITPHMVRMITGANHKKLLPACTFGGAVFLMLCDLLSRTVLRPLEIPVGVVTSIMGAAAFVWIFSSSRRKRA